MLPKMIWRYTQGQKVYLTFDDGPVPEVTPYVLDTLREAGVKATFFCVGENVEKHPDIYQRILAEGHAVGNHTYNHLNGWKTDHDTYIANVKKADQLIESPLFRPPYGKLKPSQSKAVRESHKVIMWDVLTKDYDASMTPASCMEIVRKHTTPGSIIVCHDSHKAYPRLKDLLPLILDYFVEQGLEPSALNMD